MATGTILLASLLGGTQQLSVTYDTQKKCLTAATITNTSLQTAYLQATNDVSGQVYSFSAAPNSGVTSGAIPNKAIPVAQDTDGSWYIVDWSYEFGPNPPV